MEILNCETSCLLDFLFICLLSGAGIFVVGGIIWCFTIKPMIEYNKRSKEPLPETIIRAMEIVADTEAKDFILTKEFHTKVNAKGFSIILNTPHYYEAGFIEVRKNEDKKVIASIYIDRSDSPKNNFKLVHDFIIHHIKRHSEYREKLEKEENKADKETFLNLNRK